MPLVNGRFVADMKSPRTPDNEEPAAERACDFRPVDKGFTEEMALAEAERCLNCKKPFCVEGCPVNINIPRFIEQIDLHHRWKKAWRAARHCTGHGRPSDT